MSLHSMHYKIDPSQPPLLPPQQTVALIVTVTAFAIACFPYAALAVWPLQAIALRLWRVKPPADLVPLTIAGRALTWLGISIGVVITGWSLLT